MNIQKEEIIKKNSVKLKKIFRKNSGLVDLVLCRWVILFSMYGSFFSVYLVFLVVFLY